ncbi:hypothetical protein QM012_002846 [Aureobasidium pullulans]|uniref:Uncharacterized protein n=1 Tax=Aureobasidium pullulans TaxID=5580 RepID=A0ABR0TAP3_AURPU
MSPLITAFVSHDLESANDIIISDLVVMTESNQSPPPAPCGYVLWQKQTLLGHTDAVGKPLPPHYIEIGGWKFVHIEDLAICNKASSSGLPLPERCNRELNDEPERLVEKAKVKEYIFTGSREQDICALHDYIEACNKAIQALDPANREARTLARLKLRIDMTILRESLKEELEILTEENGEDGYQGFGDGPIDECQFARSKMRAKGYRWTCPGWL